jgi:hypothetical protein
MQLHEANMNNPALLPGTTSRPAAEKAILGVPVPLPWRDFIDQTLNAVFEALYCGEGFPLGAVGRCADYAIVGARLLGKLTGHPYQAVAGGEIIDCGAGSYLVLYPQPDSLRNARILSEVRGYHCWIQSIHTGPDGTQRLELIDFTVRHDGQVARLAGSPYHAAPKSYLWDWHDALPEVPAEIRRQFAAHGLKIDWAWADPQCTHLLQQYEQQEEALFERITGVVLNTLANDLETMLSTNPA